MDLKGVFLSLCLCALVVTCTHGCCYNTGEFQRKMKRRIKSIEIQHASGGCQINALVVHLYGLKRPACVDLKREKEIRKLKEKQDMRAQRPQKNEMTKHFSGSRGAVVGRSTHDRKIAGSTHALHTHESKYPRAKH